jgi:glycosyltransferase involved in cell wall biosynthesis
MNRPTRILAVTRKPDAASYEQRVLRCIEPLCELGHTLETAVIPAGRIAQLRLFRNFRHFDTIWWQRHLAMPYDLPVIALSARRLIFDFDDPLTYTARAGGAPSWSRRTRFAWMLRTAHAVTTASEHLAESARPYCSDVTILPMPVDLPPQPPTLSQRADAPTLLWLGSRATQPYLELIRPSLEQLDDRFTLRLVAHEPMTFAGLRVDFRPWSTDEQEAALRECHLGLCPMPDTPWTRGKCPYKVLQYMAYAMPWIGSAVGENLNVAGVPGPGPGPRGWCAASTEQWLEAIHHLTNHPDTAAFIAAKARDHIAQRYDRTHLIATLEGVLVG